MSFVFCTEIQDGHQKNDGIVICAKCLSHTVSKISVFMLHTEIQDGHQSDRKAFLIKVAWLRRYKQICVFAFLAKIRKFKMTAIFEKGNIFESCKE